MRGVRRLTLLAVLLALSLVLHAVERLLPPPPVPGAHLGLANGVVLLVLWQWGAGPAAAFGLCRVAATSALGGRLGGPSFWMSLAGAGASLAVMGLARAWARGRRWGLVGLSVAGGVAHNLGQLGAFRLLVHAQGAGWLLPALVPLGALAGLVVGEGARRALPAFERAAGAGPSPAGSSPGVRAAGAALAGLLLLLLAGAAGGDGLARAALGPERSGPPGQVVLVEVAGEPPRRLPLWPDRTERLQAGPVAMVLEIKDGRVRVASSTCPERWCVRTGWIDRPGLAIVCVPARAVIRIAAASSVPSPSDAEAPGWIPDPEGPDAISR